MKKLIGLGLLALTGMTAFAAPAAARERFDHRKVVVVRHERRARNHHKVVRYERHR
ncbi:MAG TPA: hypothetical protein VHW24_26820 [Bryobacteraceae bacterium]|jgi:hypothetical protein|nr:hypothetical protein [Bryobacteraceae bacterium]